MHLTFDSLGRLAGALRRAAHPRGRRDQAPPAAQPRRFTRLPERVDPKRMVAGHQTRPARDPEAGRDTDRDFMLRYGAGGDEWDIGDV